MAASTAQTVTIGNDRTVRRIGFGALHLAGLPWVWGEPTDRRACVELLRHGVEAGVEFIDTADAYGPFVSEDIIREALHPYDGVLVATKGGYTRPSPGEWVECGRPSYLRQCLQMSLRRLGVDTVELYQLHRLDPAVPVEEQVGVLADARKAGDVRYVGLSEVSVEQLELARSVTEIHSVQNRYNLLDRGSQAVLDHCDAEGIVFLPWFPLGSGTLARADGGVLAEVAAEVGATPAQVAIAWLHSRSPVVLPIPGTDRSDHLDENLGAAAVQLDDRHLERLEAAA